ncbi:unnamed protein product [Tetraodon nigroviridis]|uniref:(spotted green pufferfish) hypothetical protein n=1 Tax=Tetraodon nigroviridis TaxID=99883 RepID=Q4S8D0_TETNG|nr:unnamed protein product [Tetraodon nigroviridis]
MLPDARAQAHVACGSEQTHRELDGPADPQRRGHGAVHRPAETAESCLLPSHPKLEPASPLIPLIPHQGGQV